MIFDGKTEDFATEMFVIINSTATRINKSHLIDLYEKVAWESKDRKLAAKIVQRLYEEPDSPLRYKINRLGGRSRQEKWILQAELFNEIHKWTLDSQKALEKFSANEINKLSEIYYQTIRDFFKAAQQVWGETWGNKDYMVTKPVTIKAMIRFISDIAFEPEKFQNFGVDYWKKTIASWENLQKDFRCDGFYERFAAKGQIERVGKIYRELKRAAGIE